jgi:hypothetical protein
LISKRLEAEIQTFSVKESGGAHSEKFASD